MVTWRRVTTPLGEVAIVADDDWLTELHLPGDAGVVPADAVEGGPTVDRAAAQLAEWFAGERRHFDLPLAPVGTAFQRRVWAALARLRPADRAILVLHYLEHLPVADAAVALGIEKNAAEARLSRARVRLREQLPADQEHVN